VGGLAAALRQAGFEAGDRLAFLLPNGPDYIELLYACQWLGVIAVPLNTRLAPFELHHLLQDAPPPGLVRHSSPPPPPLSGGPPGRPPSPAGRRGRPGAPRRIRSMTRRPSRRSCTPAARPAGPRA